MKSSNYLEQSSLRNLGANESDDSPARRWGGGGGRHELQASPQHPASEAPRGSPVFCPPTPSFLAWGHLGLRLHPSSVSPWHGGVVPGHCQLHQGPWLCTDSHHCPEQWVTVQPSDSGRHSFPEPEETGRLAPQTPRLALTGTVSHGGALRAPGSRTSSRVPQARHCRPGVLRGGVVTWVPPAPPPPPPAPRPPPRQGSPANPSQEHVRALRSVCPSGPGQGPHQSSAESTCLHPPLPLGPEPPGSPRTAVGRKGARPKGIGGQGRSWEGCPAAVPTGVSVAPDCSWDV